MNKLKLISVITGLFLSGCTAMKQFPEKSIDPVADLTKMDKHYATTLSAINAAKSEAERQKLRNEAIDQRLRVIDLHFNNFQNALAKEGVQTNFSVAVTQIGLGGVGAFVGNGTSQILSAVSGGLSGTQQAYDKSILLDKAMGALLKQMIASRKAILVKIYIGSNQDTRSYSLAAAMNDLDAYYYAGSIPGAIAATSTDATIKNSEAEIKLDDLRSNIFSKDESSILLQSYIRPPDGDSETDLNLENLNKLRDWLNASPLKGLPLQNFFSNEALRSHRESAITDLNIKPTQGE